MNVSMEMESGRSGNLGLHDGGLKGIVACCREVVMDVGGVEREEETTRSSTEKK